MKRKVFFILLSFIHIDGFCQSMEFHNIYSDVLPEISRRIVVIRNVYFSDSSNFTGDSVLLEGRKKMHFREVVTIDTCVVICDTLLNVRMIFKDGDEMLKFIPLFERSLLIDSLTNGLYHEGYGLDLVKYLPESVNYPINCSPEIPCVVVQVSDVYLIPSENVAMFIAAANCGNECWWMSFFYVMKIGDLWKIINDYPIMTQ